MQCARSSSQSALVCVALCMCCVLGHGPALAQSAQQPQQQQAPTKAEKSQPGQADAKPDIADQAFSTGLWTFGLGALGALTLAGLTFLSPCYCGLCLGIPVGATFFGSAALFASAFHNDWNIGALWFPTIVALAVGSAAGLIAGIAGVFVATAVGKTVVIDGFNPDQVTLSVTLSSVLAGSATFVVMLLGATASGFFTAALYEEAANNPVPKPRPKRRPRKQRLRSEFSSLNMQQAPLAAAY